MLVPRGTGKDGSYFPVLILLSKTGERRVIEYAEIPRGEEFRVLATNFLDDYVI